MERRDAWAMEEAQGYLDLELPHLALRALDRACPAAQDTFDGQMLRASALLAVERVDEAIPFLLRAKQHNAKAIPAFGMLGRCYKRTGQLARAVAEFAAAERIARQRRDDDARAQLAFSLAACYALSQRKAEALKWLEVAASCDPKLRRQAALDLDFESCRGDADFKAFIGLPVLPKAP